MKVWISKGAIRFVAEDWKLEADLLRGLEGRVFKASKTSRVTSTPKKGMKGAIQCYLDEIKNVSTD